MHDGVNLEKHGVPTVVLITEPFEAEARAQAEVLGRKDLKLIVLKHPVASLTESDVFKRADDVVDSLAKALVERAVE